MKLFHKIVFILAISFSVVVFHCFHFHSSEMVITVANNKKIKKEIFGDGW